jgi:hypothetical protein
LVRCFRGVRLHEYPEPGDVRAVYQTYRGLLIWFVQDEHLIFAPLADAEILLGRLLRFNLTWGMLSYGCLFIPILAVGNYRAQMRLIRRQAQKS